MKTSYAEQEPVAEKVEIEILASSDGNPRYLECVPYFIRFCQLLNLSSQGINFRPKVIYVGESIPDALQGFDQHVELFFTELPTAFVAQNVRNLAASTSTADYVITSDIDMFPLSRSAFEVGFRELQRNSDAFIVLRDVLEPGQYAICYSLASPDVFASIFEVNGRADSRKYLESLFHALGTSGGYSLQHGGTGWFTDQEDLYKRVTEFEKEKGGKVIRLKDNVTGHRRLDRAWAGGRLRWFQLIPALLGRYSDYHVHLPLSEHRKYVDALLWAISKREQIRSMWVN